MINVKDLIENRSGITISLDGEHWEPIVPIPTWWRGRLFDAIEVFRGKAGAVRNTSRSDLEDMSK